MTSFRSSLTTEQPGPHEPESDAVAAEQAGFLRLDAKKTRGLLAAGAPYRVAE